MLLVMFIRRPKQRPFKPLVGCASVNALRTWRGSADLTWLILPREKPDYVQESAPTLMSGCGFWMETGSKPCPHS